MNENTLLEKLAILNILMNLAMNISMHSAIKGKKKGRSKLAELYLLMVLQILRRNLLNQKCQNLHIQGTYQI